MQPRDHVLVRVCDGCSRAHLDVVQTERAVVCTYGVPQQRQIPSTGSWEPFELDASCAMPREMVFGSGHRRPPYRDPLSD